jgi:hypothetical protein
VDDLPRGGADVEPERRDAVDLGLFALDEELLDGEAGEDLGDRFQVRAGVHQSRQRHVTRDARGAVEIGDSH